MVCMNASCRHMFPLLIIGKSKKLWTFKVWISMSYLPNIMHKKTSSMNQAIFNEWFYNVFVPNVKWHLKSVRLLEEAMLCTDSVHGQCTDSAFSWFAMMGKLHATFCLLYPTNSACGLGYWQHEVTLSKRLYSKACLCWKLIIMCKAVLEVKHNF